MKIPLWHNFFSMPVKVLLQIKKLKKPPRTKASIIKVKSTSYTSKYHIQKVKDVKTDLYIL